MICISKMCHLEGEWACFSIKNQIKNEIGGSGCVIFLSLFSLPVAGKLLKVASRHIHIVVF